MISYKSTQRSETMQTEDRVLLLHGWGGSDDPHWQALLAGKIATNYGTVCFPLLDNCHFPSKNRWLKQTKEIIARFQPTTVVCHSLGNTLWFWLCQEPNIPTLQRLIMVSPPSLNTTEKTIKSFFPCQIPNNIHAKNIELIVSDNDPWISIDESKEIADAIGANYTLIENAGHINADSGYGEWELIDNMLPGDSHDS